MKGIILPPNGDGKFRWVVKSENKKEIIGLIVDDHWWGVSDIMQNEVLHQYYHNKIKKEGKK